MPDAYGGALGSGSGRRQGLAGSRPPHSVAQPQNGYHGITEFLLLTVVKRVSSPPIGALTGCFSSIRGGQFSALNNNEGEGRREGLGDIGHAGACRPLW